MKVPESFKNAFEKIMYCDVLRVFKRKEDVVDEYLNTKYNFEFSKDIKGNVNNTSNTILKEKYGLDIDAEYIITTNERLSLEEYILYNYKLYKIEKVLEHASHFKVFIKLLNKEGESGILFEYPQELDEASL